MPVIVRFERRGDIRGIRRINLAAFPGEAEANLVDALRERGKLLLSLVAVENRVLTGHIAFSRVTVQEKPGVYGLGLGPMAVLPERQRKGTGSALVRAGLEQCAALGCRFVVVLGHPHYYPRFGFRPAGQFGIHCRWQVPEDVFMVMEVQQGALAGVRGLACYEPEFHDV